MNHGEVRGGTYADDPTSLSMKSFPGGYGDSGNASRFFFQADWALEVAEQLAQADPVRYEAKASRAERNSGLEGMMQLRNDLTPEQRAYVLRELIAAGVVPSR